MEKILVTGGAGFIGSSVIEALLKDTKAEIFCIDNFDDTYDRAFKLDNIASFKESDRFYLFEVDITNQPELTEVFKKIKPTHVLHLAAKADTRKAVTDPYSYIDTNIIGSLNVFEASVLVGVEQVVVASSSSVYGNNVQVPWSETDLNLNPLSPYGVTKLSVEHLAYTYYKNHNLPITLLRYFNAYGERNRPGMVPYLWTEAILNNTDLYISGTGLRKRDYTYIGDIVRATVLALQNPLGFEILNVGYGSPLSLLDLLSLFETVTAKKLAPITRASHEASVEETYADVTKIKTLLGWSPEVSHEEGIKRLVDWFTAHRFEKTL